MKQKIVLLLAAALLLCSGVLARRAPRHVVPRAAELNFAFLTDVHVTPRGESDSLLRAAVAEINASAVDFVLVTGDLCNMGSDADSTACMLGYVLGAWNGDAELPPHFSALIDSQNGFDLEAMARGICDLAKEGIC